MEYIVLLIVGLAAGVLGGLLGIGGSVIMIPAMTLVLGAVADDGTEMIHQYQAAAMIVNVLLAGSSAIRHYRAGAVYHNVWKYLVPAGLVGILAGVALSRSPLFVADNARYLRWLFGVFLLYVVGYNVYRMMSAGRTSHEGVSPGQVRIMPAWKKLSIGGVMGTFAGLLGIGGGAQAVPLMQVLLHMPLRNAIATSAATIFAVSWVGALAKNMSLGVDGSWVESLRLAACLGPTAIVGAYVGGYLTHTLPLKVVRVLFVVVMLLAAWKMIVG